MQKLTLTSTVQGYLTDEGAAALLANLETVVSQISIIGGPRAGADWTEWSLEPARLQVSTLLVMDMGDPTSPHNPATTSVTFRLPAGSVTADILEEHTLLVIHQGRVWTFGDLAFTDPHRFFYGMDFRLSLDACARMSAKLLEIDPHAVATCPVWPQRTRPRWTE